MRLDEFYAGVTVYWPGAVWAQGTCTAFVRRGLILSTDGQHAEIEEHGTGQPFRKHRKALFTCPEKAKAQMKRLKARTAAQPAAPRPSGCTKHAYPDKKAAVSAINSALRRRRNNPEALRPYYCGRCQGWHLSHKDATPASGPRPRRNKPAGITPDGSIHTAEEL